MTRSEADAWQSGGLPFLQIAATCAATRALGPGTRAVVWVQGCPRHCPGCLAPDWIPMRQAQLLRPEAVAHDLLLRPDVTGLTFSGGEPMLQAAGLTQLIRQARQSRPLTLICFTGFLLEDLRQTPPGPGVADLLAEIDVLIDGPYIAAQNNNRGLRGSTNQQIHHVTNRLPPDTYDFTGTARHVEIQIGIGQAVLVGVPPTGVPALLDQALALERRAQRERREEPDSL